MFRAVLICISTIVCSAVAVAQDKESALPDNTIDCRQFKRTGPREWIEVGTAIFDLGRVRDINLTDQPVTPGYFKFGGIDLYPVLEGKCGAVAFVRMGKKDQAKGDSDGALANFNKAIELDPKLAEAYDIRGSVYEMKGDYAHAIADYDEALKLDPKLESASNRRAIAQEKLAKASPLNSLADPQITLEEAGAVMKEGLAPKGTASKVAQVPEQAIQEYAVPTSENRTISLNIHAGTVLKEGTDRSGTVSNTAQVPERTGQEQVIPTSENSDARVPKEELNSSEIASKAAQVPEERVPEQAVPTSENKNVSLKVESEDGSCRDKKLVYAADGVGDTHGEKSVVEISFEGAPDEQSRNATSSEFIIRELRNSDPLWSYKGAYIQGRNSYLFKFVESRKRKPFVLAPNYIKPNRDGTGKALLYLGGLRALLASANNRHAFKFEGKRPATLPEVFYFDRCE